MRESNVFFANYRHKFDIVHRVYKFYGPQNPVYDTWLANITDACNHGLTLACDLVNEPGQTTMHSLLFSEGIWRSTRYINNEIKPYLYDLQVGAKSLTTDAGAVRIGTVKDY